MLVFVCVLLANSGDDAEAADASPLPEWLWQHPFLAFGSDYGELAKLGVNRCHIGFCGVDFTGRSAGQAVKARLCRAQTPLPTTWRRRTVPG